MTRDKKLTYKLTPIDYIARLSDTWNQKYVTPHRTSVVHNFTQYDYKSHILSATNNLLLPLPVLHFQAPFA